jgi:hypothetical protein
VVGKPTDSTANKLSTSDIIPIKVNFHVQGLVRMHKGALL